MAATVMSGEPAGAAEVEAAACDCCGLMEECTPTYIARVRERYGGRWICGLCGDAVAEEISRSSPASPISSEEALARHGSFCRTFRSASPSPPVDNAERLIAAVRQLLRRGLGSPRAARSTPTSPRSKGDTSGASAGAQPPALALAESCFSALAG